MAPFVRSILLSGLMLALAGCLNLGKRLETAERQFAEALSGPAITPDGDAPVSTLVGSTSTAAKLDATERRLLRGIEARLRGADAPRVLNDLAVGTPEDLPDYTDALAGLKLREILLTPEAAPTPKEGSRSLAAILRFGDAAGHSLNLSVASLFSASDDRIEITDLTVKQIAKPRAAELFLPPAAQNAG